MKAALGIALSFLVIVFVTLGAVLLAYFWARRLSISVRALAACGLAMLVLIGPIVGIMGADGSLSPVAIIAMAMGFLVIAFPVAFLSTRKLDRSKQDISSIFD